MCICVARLRTRRVMASSHASWTLGHLCPCPIGKGASPPFILTQMHQCHYEPFSPVQEPSCGRPHCSCDGCWPGAQQAAVDPACQFSRWTNPHSGLDLCVAILFVAHAQPASKLESEQRTAQGDTCSVVRSRNAIVRKQLDFGRDILKMIGIIGMCNLRL